MGNKSKWTRSFLPAVTLISEIIIEHGVGSLSGLGKINDSYNIYLNQSINGSEIESYYRIDQIPLTIGFKDISNGRDYDSTTTASSHFTDTELYNIAGNVNDSSKKCNSKIATVMYTESNNCEYIYSINTTAKDFTNKEGKEIYITGFTVKDKSGNDKLVSNYNLHGYTVASYAENKMSAVYSSGQTSYREFNSYEVDHSNTTKLTSSVTHNGLTYTIVYRKDSIATAAGQTVTNNRFILDDIEYTVNGNQFFPISKCIFTICISSFLF